MTLTLGRSISTRVISMVLLVLVVGQGVGAVLFLTSIRHGFLDSLHERMKLATSQAAGVLGEATVTYNTSLMESYITEAFKDRDIVAIKVTDKSGGVMKEQVRQKASGRTFSVTQPVLFLGEPAGTIKLDYAATTIDGSMQGSLLLIPVYQGGMLLVVAMVLIRMFKAYVKRPVEQLSLAIGKITGGDLTAEVPVFREDEIGAIANGVKFLAQRLSGTTSRIHSISGKVTEAVHHLMETFDGVRDVIESQNQSTEEVSLAVRSAAATQLQIFSTTEQLLSLSNDNLATLQQMRTSSEKIATTTDGLTENLQDSYSTLIQLATTAGEVSRMADEVVAFVAEVSSSVEEVYGSVKHVESMINQSSQLSTRTSATISGKGMEAASAVIAAMKRIGAFIDTHMAAIERLGERSRDIDKILGVIEDVTEKSRLLSLNAQIIAAQAGEHGKGFAVVAEEMKQLAERASVSTGEIAGIVTAIQREIGTVVKDAGDNVAVVRNGEAVADKTAMVLDEILATALQADELAKSIERAALEQTRSLSLVVHSTEQIRDRISAVNKAAGEQETSTGQLLNALHPIREGMEITRTATGEQAQSSVSIAGNIEMANSMNADIAAGSADQHQLNQRVVDALQTVVHLGQSTVTEVNGLIPHMTAMREDMETLRLEMAYFRL